MKKLNDLESQLTKNLTFQVTSLHDENNGDEFTVENNSGTSFTYASENDFANYKKIEFASNCLVGFREAADYTDDDKIDGVDFSITDDLRIMGIYNDKYFIKVDLKSNKSRLHLSIPVSIYFGTGKYGIFNHIGKNIHIIFSF